MFLLPFSFTLSSSLVLKFVVCDIMFEEVYSSLCESGVGVLHGRVLFGVYCGTIRQSGGRCVEPLALRVGELVERAWSWSWFWL